MAASSEAARMQSALKEAIIPLLRQAGFRGSYPHFRRIAAHKVDLVSFVGCGVFGGGYGVDFTANGAELVQQADEGIYDRVAAETARQLPVLLAWFDSIAIPDDLARCPQCIELRLPAP